MAILQWIKTHVNQLISLAVSIMVVYIAILQGPALVSAMKQVRLNWAIAGLGCYGINYFLRALRIKLLLEDRIRMWPDALHTACLHGLATYLIPFRFGDFTLPVILNKAVNLNFSIGARLLITIRLSDLCALGFWIIIAAILIDVLLPARLHQIWVLFGVALMIVPLLLKWVVKMGGRLKGKVWQWAYRWGEGATFGLEVMLLSAGSWACVGACFFCTAQAIGLPLKFMEVWLLISIQLPLQMVPLQGVANAGNHEGGWIAGLALLGIPAEQGLSFALLSHALVLIYVLTLGPLAYLIRSSPNHVSPKKG
jgi:uncharacterized membrane protein YbhN (UPF0104 family)